MESHWKIAIEAWPKFPKIGDPGFTERDLREKLEVFLEDMGYQSNVIVTDLRQFVEGGR